ncbi:MAG: type II toxin-antitoxin system Phd/YefM family antitoxin [Longimicrobiales bacterium]
MKERAPASKAVEVSASEVKKGWHRYVDRVAQARETIVVTRYGRPVAKLSPMEAGDVSGAGSLVGSLAGTVTFHGDVVGPTGETWEADG